MPGLPRERLLLAEYPLVRWLERNGYDVVVLREHRHPPHAPPSCSNRKVFISSGHDEYWSGAMRANVEAARDAGVHLDLHDRQRGVLADALRSRRSRPATPNRTLVCYKETLDHAKIDPSPEWTGTWRDPRFSPPAQRGGAPRTPSPAAVRGHQPADDADFAIEVPAEYSASASGATPPSPSSSPARSRRRSPGARSATSSTSTSTTGGRPAGLIRLSSTTVGPTQVLQDYAGTYIAGPITHNMTMYRAPSGALVWGTGTVQWAYGLDDYHTQPIPRPGAGRPSACSRRR